MLDLDVILGQASLPERTIRVCLDGTVLGQLAEAQDHLGDEADRIARDLQYRLSVLGVDDRDTAAEQVQAEALEHLRGARGAYDAAQQAVRDAQQPFRLRALSPHALPALRVQHPPRPGDDSDKQAGVNLDTYLPELVRLCLVDPQPSDEQWPRLLAVLQEGELRRLSDAAYGLTHRQAALGPTSLGSAPSRSSDAA